MRSARSHMLSSFLTSLYSCPFRMSLAPSLIINLLGVSSTTTCTSDKHTQADDQDRLVTSCCSAWGCQKVTSKKVTSAPSEVQLVQELKGGPHDVWFAQEAEQTRLSLSEFGTTCTSRSPGPSQMPAVSAPKLVCEKEVELSAEHRVHRRFRGEVCVSQAGLLGKHKDAATAKSQPKPCRRRSVGARVSGSGWK